MNRYLRILKTQQPQNQQKNMASSNFSPRLRIQPGSRTNQTPLSEAGRLQLASPINKRPKFDLPTKQGSTPTQQAIRLCTKSPDEIKFDIIDDDICTFDRNGWILFINTNGTIGTWEIHHTLPGETAHSPRKVYIFNQPNKDSVFEKSSLITMACLLTPLIQNNEENRSLVAGSTCGNLFFWSDVKTHLGRTITPITHTLSNGLNDDDFLVSILPIESKSNEVIVCTNQGRVFRVVVDGRLREIQHIELSKKSNGWKDTFSNVLFKTGPVYFVKAKSVLHHQQHHQSSEHHQAEIGTLILTQTSLVLWSGEQLDYNSELSDLSEQFSSRLHQIQGRLEESVLLDITSNNQLGYSWILACSQGPLIQRHQSSSSSSSYLTLHRISVSVGGRLSLSTATSDGEEDLLLVHLVEHEASEHDKWEILESDSLIPNFIICRNAMTNHITAVFTSSTSMGNEGEEQNSERTIRSCWDQNFGEGFRVASFDRKFPSNFTLKGLDDGYLLSAGVLEHTSDLFLVGTTGDTYLLSFLSSSSLSSSTNLSYEVSQLQGLHTSEEHELGGSLSSLSTGRSITPSSTLKTETFSTISLSSITPTQIADSLRQAFECSTYQGGTANQIALYLKPIRMILDMGHKELMLNLVTCVVELSIQVVDASLDGSALVHHVLDRKVIEHRKLCLFFEQFVLSSSSSTTKTTSSRHQHPEWLKACADAKTSILMHRQQLAGACALRLFMSQMSSSSSPSTTSDATTMQGFTALQKALVSVAEGYHGSEGLRSLRLATGLAEYDLFFESPTKSMRLGLESLVNEAKEFSGSMEAQLILFRITFLAIHKTLIAAKKVNLSMNHNDLCWIYECCHLILELFKSFQEKMLELFHSFHLGNHNEMNNKNELINSEFNQIIHILLFNPLENDSQHNNGDGGGGTMSLSELMLISFKYYHFKVNTSGNDILDWSYHNVKQICFTTLVRCLELASDGGHTCLNLNEIISTNESSRLFMLCRDHLHFDGLLELCFYNASTPTSTIPLSMNDNDDKEKVKIDNACIVAISKLCSQLANEIGTDGVTFRQFVLQALLNKNPPDFYRPSFALKIGAIEQKPEEMKEQEPYPTLGAILTNQIADTYELKWLNELRMGLGLSYDEINDKFISKKKANSKNNDNQNIFNQDLMLMNQGLKSDALSLKTPKSVKQIGSMDHGVLCDCGVSLLNVGLMENQFESRETILSLSKLALLASSYPEEDDGGDKDENVKPHQYPPLSPFQTSKFHSVQLKRHKDDDEDDEEKEYKEEMIKSVELNLSLLQVQRRLGTLIPNHSSTSTYEEPQVMLSRIIQHMDYVSMNKQKKDFDLFEVSILGLTLVDILNALEQSEIDNDHDDENDHSDHERSGLYYCQMSAKTGDILIDIKVNPANQSCQGQGLGYRGFFDIDGINSEWNISNVANEDIILMIRSPGGGIGFGSTYRMNTNHKRNEEIHMQYHPNSKEIIFGQGKFIKISKEKAILVRSRIELKILGIKFWSAVIRQDMSKLNELINMDNSNNATDLLNKTFKELLLCKLIFEHVKGLKNDEFRANDIALQWYPSSSSSEALGVRDEQSNLTNKVFGSSDFIKLEDLEYDQNMEERAFSLLKQCISSAQHEAASY